MIPGPTYVRVAMTQTINQWGPMPQSLVELDGLRDRLDDIRRANLDHHLRLLERAARDDVKAICFGELFCGPYFALSDEPMWREMAEPIDGPTVQRLQEAAREHEMVIVAPIYELDVERNQRFNTAVFIDADGEVLGRYSKVHIPHGENEANPFLERHYYDGAIGRPNTHPSNISPYPFFPVFNTRAGRLGCAICYDRHFEGVMSGLAKGGAQIVFCPAVTFGKKSQRLWEMEFAVDATRNHIYIGGSNREGSEPPWNQPFYGGTHFVGPNGRCADQSDHPELVVCDLPVDQLAHPDPAGWDLKAHRRPEVHTADETPER